MRASCHVARCLAPRLLRRLAVPSRNFCSSGVFRRPRPGHDENMSANIVELTFLGTSSARPTKTRNHSCVALKIDAAVWLFDCGEACQVQLAKAENLKMSKVTKIFITHMHGDHVFGLPGTLSSCIALKNRTLSTSKGGGEADGGTVDMDSEKPADLSQPPLDVYGPRPLRVHIRDILRRTSSHIEGPYRVHELLRPDEEDMVDDGELHPCEIKGTDIRQGEDGCWHLDLGDAERNLGEVIAAPLPHTIPSMGYVFREREAAGRLRIDLVKPHVDRNEKALRAQDPSFKPHGLYGKIKLGQEVRLPDGTVLDPKEMVGPPRPGRAVAFLGDTNGSITSEPMLRAARDADVVVHEATNALTSRDPPGTTREKVEQKARDHGHSTPAMAAEFAKAVNAKLLALTHFSSRYRGDDDEESVGVMNEIRDAAKEVFPNEVLTAVDLMVLKIPKRS